MTINKIESDAIRRAIKATNKGDEHGHFTCSVYDLEEFACLVEIGNEYKKYEDKQKRKASFLNGCFIVLKKELGQQEGNEPTIKFLQECLDRAEQIERGEI